VNKHCFDSYCGSVMMRIYMCFHAVACTLRHRPIPVASRVYDTIRDAILTCAQKLTWVSLIYRTEPSTKSGKKLKSKKWICFEILVGKESGESVESVLLCNKQELFGCRMFELVHMRHLDVSYNLLTCIPSRGIHNATLVHVKASCVFLSFCWFLTTDGAN